ncbi:hypothetical protein MMC17_004946 [Xylographa soralifera]|nr:hypothetical protein [Xylographa soralifera]
MPPHHPLFGHLQIVGSIMSKLPGDVHGHVLPRQIELMFPKLGPIFYVDTWPFGPPILAVASPDGAHQITQVHSLPKFHALRDYMRPATGGNDLVTMEGKEWKTWRNIFNPGFSSGHIMTLLPEMLKDVSIFCEILRDLAEKQDIFLMDLLTTRLSLDIIGRVALDTRLNSQRSTNDFVLALRNQITWLSFGNEANLFERYHPLRPFMSWWNDRKMIQYVSKELDARFQINLGRSETTKENRSKTIIDLALANYLAEQTQTRPSHGIDGTFRHFAICQIRTFILAGHDSTSSTICYAFHLLSTHPSIRRLLIAEHNNVLGPDYKEAASRITDSPHLLNQLPYTLAVVKETLRLYPPASSIRGGEPDHFIHGPDGRHLPTDGFLVWANAYTIHHDPSYWPEPYAFLPDRWLVAEGHRLYPLKGAYRPFEFGPRNCIGQELAMLELKIVLIMTAREFAITTVYEEWDTLHPMKGPKHVNGDRAYQILSGSAHPCDGLPCRVSLVDP